MSQNATDSLGQLVSELQHVSAKVSARSDELGRRAAAARFAKVRDEAVTICRTRPGALVAALQMKRAPFDGHGVARVLELLERVRRDSVKSFVA